jgi:small-conductance mechanosensitive channel/CRP-like cAMP-binding protein
MTTPLAPRQKLKRVLYPLFLSVLLGALLYSGGEFYQSIGITGLDTIHQVLGHILGIGVFIALAVFLQRITQYVIMDGIVASMLGTPAPRLLSQIATFVIYLLTITIIIGVVFKKDLTVLLAASGAAGIVIGMALQQLILDVFAGLAINLDRAIKMGDSIVVHQVGDDIIEGKVIEISWRTTRVQDRFCNIIIVPNSRLSSSTITNFSQPQEFLETNIVVMFDVEVPTERVIRVLQAAAVEATTHFAIPNAPAPAVAVRNLTWEGVEYGVYIYPNFESRFRARNLLYQCVLRHLRFAGLRPAIHKQEFLGERPHDYKTYLQPHITHLIASIGRTEIFQDLTEEELTLMATFATLRQMPVGTLVVQGGEVATVMYLLIEGLLAAESRTRKVGMNKQVASEILSPGTLIGGTAMLSGDTYEATVSCKSLALLCEINHDLLDKLLTLHPAVVHKLSLRVAAQLARRNLSTGANEQWQTNDADLEAEVLRQLKRAFAHLQLN